jgi:Zn-finger nucleic acid-binding protein
MSTGPSCPKCRDTILRSPEGRATRLLRCPDCRGTWLPKDEARIEAVGDLLEHDTIRPSKPEDLKTGLCPFGHGILIRARVELEEPFYLDRCNECGGIWFDKGEWNKLARGHLLDHLHALWDPAVRFRLQKQRADLVFKQKLESEVGTEAFKHLLAIAELLQHSDQQAKLAAIAFLRETLESPRKA